jgi:hypothetical protein
MALSLFRILRLHVPTITRTPGGVPLVAVVLLGDCENTINKEFIRIVVIPKAIATMTIATNCILAT